MVTYPIYIPRNSYGGADSIKRVKSQTINNIASRLESYINDKLKNQSEAIHVYSYHEIATETGIDYEIVSSLGFGIDGGSGGFTAYKSGLTQE